MITGESEHGQATRTKVVDVAEGLFAERGFDQVTLRALTSAAGVNIAAVNYYFHSKQGLIDAVVMRHLEPINARRRENLAALQDADEELSVPAVLRALFQPFADHVGASEKCGKLLMKFMARVVDAANPRIPKEVVPDMSELLGDYVALLKRCLPSASEQAIWKRIHFTYGVFATTMMQTDLLVEVAGDAVGELVMDELLEDIIQFCSAGFLILEKEVR